MKSRYFFIWSEPWTGDRTQCYKTRESCGI